MLLILVHIAICSAHIIYGQLSGSGFRNPKFGMWHYNEQYETLSQC